MQHPAGADDELGVISPSLDLSAPASIHAMAMPVLRMNDAFLPAVLDEHQLMHQSSPVDVVVEPAVSLGLPGQDTAVQWNQGNAAAVLDLDDVAGKLQHVMSRLQAVKVGGEKCLVQAWMPHDNSPLLASKCYWASFLSRQYGIGPTQGEDSMEDMKLSYFRNCSEKYRFCFKEDGEGLPGRVFVTGRAEMTLDVQKYNHVDYFRLLDAQKCGIHSTIAIPVYQRVGSQLKTVAAIEVVNLETHFTPIIDQLANLLETVDLSSWGRSMTSPSLRMSLHDCQRTESVLSNVMEACCREFDIALAQFWAPEERKNGSCNKDTLLSCSCLPSCVQNRAFLDYRKSSSNLLIVPGCGFVGKAWNSKNSIWHPNAEAVLMGPSEDCLHIGAKGLVAIPMFFSEGEESQKFILELFLPPDIVDEEEQRQLIVDILVLLLKVGKGTFYIGSRLEHWQDESKGSIALAQDELGNERSSTSDFGSGSAREKASKSKKVELPLSSLQKYFHHNLKDAAKKLGICPTTLKRICRNYNIARWPCRKLKKVNRSITKLTGVVESVGVNPIDMGILAGQVEAKKGSCVSEHAWQYQQQRICGGSMGFMPGPSAVPSNGDFLLGRPVHLRRNDRNATGIL
mmetsp:Transcript_15537/g.39556  ORF Transcript_15537/g.39556 Transcript_15537/m.39556 type:complete len:625 (-) Transcript_15537:1077-2951(-)